MTEENKGLTRRTVVKGAAWSVPVIAVAVGTPLASASVAWNASVTANCTNDYDVSALQNILDGLGLGGLLGTVQTTLAGLGFTAGATRGFTITAETGTVPAGTSYLLADPNTILTLTGLQSVIAADVAFVASTAEGYTITLANPIAAGSSLFIDLYDAIVNVGALSSLTLTQMQADANGGDNSATAETLAAAAVNLGGITALAALGVTGSLAVQTCDL